MKRLSALLLAGLLLLSGCSGASEELDRAMGLRARLLGSGQCSFDMTVTADYGEEVSTFGLSCEGEGEQVRFTVTSPETIAGITGTLSQDGGQLTFDGQAVAFEMLAQGELSPVSAPWLFLRTLRSGCVTACGKDGEQVRLSADDSYEDDALHLDIWLDDGDCPVRAEVTWQNCRVLSMAIENFKIG